MRVCMALSVLLLVLAVPAYARTDQDLESTFQRLKEAEANRDAGQVSALAADVFELAAGEQFADVRLRAEYALYSTALAAKPEDTIALLSTLERLNCRSKYLDAGYSTYFLALQRTGQAARIPTVAQAALKNFPDNEDLLLVLADAAMARNQTARAASYAERLIGVVAAHPKPEGYAAQDWARKRDLVLGRARWMAGVAHSEKQQYGDADKDLRAALPLVKNDGAVLASTLFHLGVANYQIGATMLDKARVLEAAKFSDQAAAIPGPLSQQAWRNAHAMRQAAQQMR